MAVENVWGLVAVLTFYIVILVIGIVAGRKQLRRNVASNTTETMLAGRDIGMVSSLLWTQGMGLTIRKWSEQFKESSVLNGVKSCRGVIPSPSIQMMLFRIWENELGTICTIQIVYLARSFSQVEVWTGLKVVASCGFLIPKSFTIASETIIFVSLYAYL